jgi:hypothetical protein
MSYWDTPIGDIVEKIIDIRLELHGTEIAVLM